SCRRCDAFHVQISGPRVPGALRSDGCSAFCLTVEITRATARVAPTIHFDVENRQLGIVGATLAVALAIIRGRPGTHSQTLRSWYWVCFIFLHSSTIVSVADLAQQYLPVHNKLILAKK